MWSGIVRSAYAVPSVQGDRLTDNRDLSYGPISRHLDAGPAREREPVDASPTRHIHCERSARKRRGYYRPRGRATGRCELLGVKEHTGFRKSSLPLPVSYERANARAIAPGRQHVREYRRYSAALSLRRGSHRDLQVNRSLLQRWPRFACSSSTQRAYLHDRPHGFAVAESDRRAIRDDSPGHLRWVCGSVSGRGGGGFSAYRNSRRSIDAVYKLLLVPELSP
ncbi:hypothetical protein PYCCODRAFT_1239243 [Trametes coccinea BRFM310]|uniref:Uncharacterized protein n=1 Tax=Trametes coccinea (strain BRFM310) TaxID=1353009 RepID=A0A1Y2IWE8_TRAC3|nr:hypothetical protein PYCCODRAFT_1239243 [Trametes coccinea BRFM310]